MPRNKAVQDGRLTGRLSTKRTYGTPGERVARHLQPRGRGFKGRPCLRGTPENTETLPPPYSRRRRLTRSCQ